MAWIEFHASAIKRLPKFKGFRRALSWSPNEALGFLGAFWVEVLEVSEDGDITDWEKVDVAEAGGATSPSERVWDALERFRWIELKGNRVLIHDWLDYAGTYLKNKYGRGRGYNPAVLREIWAKHGRVYGSSQEEQAALPAEEAGKAEPPSTGRANDTSAEEQTTLPRKSKPPPLHSSTLTLPEPIPEPSSLRSRETRARVDGPETGQSEAKPPGQSHFDRAAAVLRLYPDVAPKDGRAVGKSIQAQNVLGQRIAEKPDYPWEEHAQLVRQLDRTPKDAHRWAMAMPDGVALEALRRAKEALPQPVTFDHDSDAYMAAVEFDKRRRRPNWQPSALPATEEMLQAWAAAADKILARRPWQHLKALFTWLDTQRPAPKSNFLWRQRITGLDHLMELWDTGRFSEFNPAPVPEEEAAI